MLTRLWAAVSGRRAAHSRTIYAGLAPLLFCLSTVRNVEYLSPRGLHTNVYGWQVPCKLMPWVEVIIHRLLFPSSSMFSQPGGLLAGYLYACRRQVVAAISHARR